MSDSDEDESSSETDTREYNGETIQKTVTEGLVMQYLEFHRRDPRAIYGLIVFAFASMENSDPKDVQHDVLTRVCWAILLALSEDVFDIDHAGIRLCRFDFWAKSLILKYTDSFCNTKKFKSMPVFFLAHREKFGLNDEAFVQSFLYKILDRVLSPDHFTFSSVHVVFTLASYFPGMAARVMEDDRVKRQLRNWADRIDMEDGIKNSPYLLKNISDVFTILKATNPQMMKTLLIDGQRPVNDRYYIDEETTKFIEQPFGKEVYRHLLECGANPNSYHPTGRPRAPPVISAIEHFQSAALMLLCEFGADVLKSHLVNGQQITPKKFAATMLLSLEKSAPRVAVQNTQEGFHTAQVHRTMDLLKGMIRVLDQQEEIQLQRRRG
jgi:hypothetical protein